MSDMERPTVGDEMLLVEAADRRVALTYPVRVTKLGRKYFYVETLDPKKSWVCQGLSFDIETGWQANTRYGDSARVTTEAALRDERRREQLIRDLRAVGLELGYGSLRRRITTDQLARIAAIVEEASDEASA